jgi:hypothetical protein
MRSLRKMSEANNGQDPALTPAQSKPKWNRYTAKFCPQAKRERIVNSLAAGEPKYLIARTLHVSEHTIYAVAEQEWQKVAERKARIAAQSERNATRAPELIAEKLESENVPLNALVPVYGVSVDKAIALRGDPSLHVSVDHLHSHIHANIQPASLDDIRNALRDPSYL